jgi:hypothetical protein
MYRENVAKVLLAAALFSILIADAASAQTVQDITGGLWDGIVTTMAKPLSPGTNLTIGHMMAFLAFIGFLVWLLGGGK